MTEIDKLINELEAINREVELIFNENPQELLDQFFAQPFAVKPPYKISYKGEVIQIYSQAVWRGGGNVNIPGKQYYLYSKKNKILHPGPWLEALPDLLSNLSKQLKDLYVAEKKDIAVERRKKTTPVNF